MNTTNHRRRLAAPLGRHGHIRAATKPRASLTHQAPRRSTSGTHATSKPLLLSRALHFRLNIRWQGSARLEVEIGPALLAVIFTMFVVTQWPELRPLLRLFPVAGLIVLSLT
jgi:hypothetical protein